MGKNKYVSAVFQIHEEYKNDTSRLDTILEIANYADKAVYYAKNAGRNAIYELIHGERKDSDSDYIRIDF